jgi:HSP20 family protein
MFDSTRKESGAWSPFRELEDMSERFSRLLGRFPRHHDVGREAMTVADWVPTVDIAEDDREYLIKAEVPEVDKKDVRVTVQEGVLTIQGVRRKEIDQKNRRFHRVERSYGTFVRSFTLPEDAAEERLRAEFKDGVLLVHLPKSEKAKTKSLDVKVE